MINEDKKYYYAYPHPAIAADCVIFGLEQNDLKIVLIKRKSEPFKNSWALPGGFMNINETPIDAVKREVKEETNLKLDYIELIDVFGNTDRDPRERVVSIAYWTLTRVCEIAPHDDAADAQWFSIKNLPELAFDHKDIIHSACEKLDKKLKESK